MNIVDRLFELQDVEFQKFHGKLVPNIPAESIIGVKIPLIRDLAKELFNDPCKAEFLNELPHKYYEENQLHIILVCMEKEFSKCVEGLDKFLPYADNWAVTDQPSPKCFKKHHEELVPIATKWLESDNVYVSRFGMNVFMREFLGDDFCEIYPEMISKKQGDDYYLKMMIAWYFATALAKKYDEVITFFEQRKLEPWTHNKAIQKALESFRVCNEHKEYLRTLKV